MVKFILFPMITAPKPYTFHTKPYKHQEQEFLRSCNLPYYALFWDMGAGKSKTIIDTTIHLFYSQEIDGALIISDKGCYLTWSREEIPKHAPTDTPMRICEWSSAMRKREEEISKVMLAAKNDCLDIVVMNVEAFSSPRACEYAWKFIQSHYCMIVVDEATSIKNIRAQRTKNLIKLARNCDYRRILTGTPITQSPLDVYSMCEFLKDACLGFRGFVPFRSHYAIMQKRYLGPNRPSFDEIVGFRNLDELANRLEPFSSRIMKEQCLDLPPKIYETVTLDLTEDQRMAYDSLKRTAILQLEQGLLTSTNALTTMNKLLQICSGHVNLDDGHVVDLANNKIPELVELLEKIPGKVLIWCAFQRDVELIMEAIQSRWKNRGAVHYYGKTTMEARANALSLFKLCDDVRWFVGTMATGGKGLNLTEANYVIYYSNSFSLEDRLQSEDRPHRPGQTKPVTYIDLVTNDTCERRVLEALKSKNDLSHKVLDRLRDLLEDRPVL